VEVFGSSSFKQNAVFRHEILGCNSDVNVVITCPSFVITKKSRLGQTFVLYWEFIPQNACRSYWLFSAVDFIYILPCFGAETSG